MDAYLPTLLAAAAQAAGQPKMQFLLLAALNEALTSLAAPDTDASRLSDANRDQVPVRNRRSFCGECSPPCKVPSTLACHHLHRGLGMDTI